jgi:hypothetical protein
MSPCYDIIEDGSFEWVDDYRWIRPFTLARAVYTTNESHWGFQSMRMGIEPGEPVAYTWSATYQYISIPLDATSATLRFWWQRHTEEATLSAMPLKPGLEGEMLPLSSLNYTEDLHLVVLYDASMTYLVEELERGRANDSGWVGVEHDLTHWRGHTLVLYFNAYNHDYSGRTWMYVDDVELEICLPSSP